MTPDFTFQAIRHPLACMGQVSLWLMLLDASRVLVLVARPDTLHVTNAKAPFGEACEGTRIFGGMVNLTNRGHNRVAIEAAGYMDRTSGIFDPKRHKYLEHRTGPIQAPDTVLTAPMTRGYCFRLAECLWAFPHADVFLSFPSPYRFKAIRDAKRALINHYAPDSHHKEV